jgi:hypothetical protein
MKYTIEELEEINDPDFSAPIPGLGLTNELGSRAWEQPPRYPTVVEALDFYTDSLFTKEGISSVADGLQMGIPAIDLAEKLTTSAAMQGLHSVDVGVLVVPAVAEAAAMIGNLMDIDFKMGNEDEDAVVSDSMIALVTKRMSDAIGEDRGLGEALNLDDFELSDEDTEYLDMEDYEAADAGMESMLVEEEPFVDTKNEAAMLEPVTTKEVDTSRGLMSRRV